MLYRLLLTFSMLCFTFIPIDAAPTRNIPPELLSEYTLEGKIPVVNQYFDGTYTTPLVYTQQEISANIMRAIFREKNYYGETDRYLYYALDELTDSIRGKEVALIGSSLPWYESVLLAYGAYPVVIEYNAIQCEDYRITYLTPDQFKENPKKFDLVLSISSTEHDGLGRYGDPLNPNGDLESMKNFQSMLNPNGKLLLAIPVGPDKLYWNANRVYGPLRLKMLFNGWKIVKYYGFTSEHLTHTPKYQPVFLLEVKKQ